MLNLIDWLNEITDLAALATFCTLKFDNSTKISYTIKVKNSEELFVAYVLHYNKHASIFFLTW